MIKYRIIIQDIDNEHHAKHTRDWLADHGVCSIIEKYNPDGVPT